MLTMNNVLALQMNQPDFNDVSSIETGLEYVLKELADVEYLKREFEKVDMPNEIDNVFDKEEIEFWIKYVEWAYNKLEIDRKRCDKRNCIRYWENCVYNCKAYKKPCKYISVATFEQLFKGNHRD